MNIRAPSRYIGMGLGASASPEGVMVRALRLFALLLLVAAPLSAQRSRRAPARRTTQAARARATRQAGPPAPASVLGFVPGTERRLVEWDTIVRYFRALDAASNRVQVRELGKTTNGAPFLVAYIS